MSTIPMRIIPIPERMGGNQPDEIQRRALVGAQRLVAAVPRVLRTRIHAPIAVSALYVLAHSAFASACDVDGQADEPVIDSCTRFIESRVEGLTAGKKVDFEFVQRGKDYVIASVK